jgi:ubiquinone/menaquinone biosynthesis C-methylase UbiE
VREEADIFAKEYIAIRHEERWAERSKRGEAVARATAVLQETIGPRALIADVGSGGEWVAGSMGTLDVIAIDLVDTGAQHGLNVRGDMRRLPLNDASVDGLLYAASLHYAPLRESIPEAARVLRTGGCLIAIDSPLYRGDAAVLRAIHRSAAYYEGAGHPALEAHYHPIDVGELRSALVDSGFDIARLDTGSRWSRLAGRGPTSFVLARKLR